MKISLSTSKKKGANRLIESLEVRRENDRNTNQSRIEECKTQIQLNAEVST